MKDLILAYLKIIPKWKVETYSTIWKKFNIHPRKVANILSRNYDQDIFPCYKIIMSDWKIWWYNLWTKEKESRLKKDWIEVIWGKVDIERYLNK